MANTVTLEDAHHHVIATFGTIQAAVNAAAKGEIILVGAGTYQEQVTVDGLKNLTIEGAGQGQTIILSPDAANLVANLQNPGEFHSAQQDLVGAEKPSRVTI